MEDLKVEKGSLVEENANLKKEIQIFSENKVLIDYTWYTYEIFQHFCTGNTDHTMFKNGANSICKPKTENELGRKDFAV